jgi:hypothetical protein
MLRQRFPLYDRFYRFSLQAVRWHLISSFVLVYGMVRLTVLATTDVLMPIWARVGMLVGATTMVALTALLLWPMSLINFALRFHPISRETLNRFDRGENFIAVLSLLTGITSLITCSLLHLPVLALSGAVNVLFFGVTVAGATWLRPQSNRGAVAFMTILWLVVNGLAFWFIFLSRGAPILL